VNGLNPQHHSCNAAGQSGSYDFLSPKYYLVDHDAAIKDKWTNAEAKPVVFIQGVRRSGTTFLLNTLQQVTNAAALTVHDIAYYRQRVLAKRKRCETTQLANIARFLQQNHLTHRPIDNVPLSPKTLDEFGFVYTRLGVDLRETWLLSEIVAKLCFLYSAAPFVLLKEPAIFASSSVAHRTFSRAKFVFVHRNPVKTLISRCRALFWRRSLNRDWAYLHLLAGRRRPLSARVRSLLGLHSKRRIAMGVAREIAKDIEVYQRDIREVPPEQVLHVEYEDLIRAADSVLGRIISFLDVVPVMPLNTVKPEPRRQSEVDNEVRVAGDWLTTQLRLLDYQHSSLG
jgi:hypothetical protein